MLRERFGFIAAAIAYGVSAVALPFLIAVLPGPPIRVWTTALGLAFALPTAALIVWLLFRQLAARDGLRAQHQGFRGTHQLVLNAGVAFVVVLHLILLTTLLGGVEWVSRAPSLLVGALLVLVGNTLPRLRPNLVVGVRTPWSLADDQAWARTHWVSGYGLVAFGRIVLAFAILAPQWLGRVVSLGAFAMAAILIAVSYWSRRSR